MINKCNTAFILPKWHNIRNIAADISYYGLASFKINYPKLAILVYIYDKSLKNPLFWEILFNINCKSRDYAK